MKKYNPIKKINAYCVIQGRNTVARDTLFLWKFLARNKKEPQQVLTIFSSRRKAMLWINQWLNAEEFTCVKIKFEIPEAN